MIKSEGVIFKTVFLPLIVLCVLILCVTVFAFRETRQVAMLSSERVLVEQLLKVSDEAISSKDHFELNKNMQALLSGRVRVKIRYADKTTIQFPKDYFSTDWDTSPSFTFRHVTQSGESVEVQAWSILHEEPWSIYALYLAVLIIGGVLFWRAAKHLSWWQDDLERTAEILVSPEGQDSQSLANFEPTAQKRIHYDFFRKIALFAAEARNAEEQFRLKEAKSREAVMLSAVATQVSHDIRSPLATLISVAHNSPGLPEDARVQLRGAANRIRDIANQLLDKNREHNRDKNTIVLPGAHLETHSDAGVGNGNANVLAAPGPSVLSQEERSTQLLSAVLESAVSSKRLQYAENPLITIESHTDDVYGLFANLQLTEFSRVVSNLVNNSVEAFEKGGRIDVSLREEGGRAVIEVRDNGKGIPPHLLAKIGVQGETHGKAGGSGLGVYHARKTIESWGGSLEIESNQDSGTAIRLKLLKADAPAWFAPKVPVEGMKTIVVLDDDPGIHQIWESRLCAYQAARLKSEEAPESPPKSAVVVLHFYSAQEILKWFRSSLGLGEAGDTPLYLCDYELGGPKGETGLDVIEKLGIASQSILVTSRYDEAAIQERCVRFGARLLPKWLAHRVSLG
ncbi:HAMP domain-containing sensor histidine kinase [Bdellovibrionota bacterium FG-2]